MKPLDNVFDDMWNIFEDEGMFDTATFQPASGDPYDIVVDFRQGAADVFDGAARTLELSITYRRADASLQRGSMLVIDGTQYRVVADPEPDKTGLNATAELQKMPP